MTYVGGSPKSPPREKASLECGSSRSLEKGSVVNSAVFGLGISKREGEFDGGRGESIVGRIRHECCISFCTQGKTEVGSGKISFHLVFGEGGKGNKLGEVGREELGHAEGADAVVAEHLCHLLVGGEVLLVLGVLQVVLLDVGPQLLDALGAGRLLLPDDVGQLGAELHGLGET